MNKFQNKFSSQEIELLKSTYPFGTKEEILKIFPGRDYGTIKWKANSLGIYKKRAIQVKTNLDSLLLENNESYYWIGFLMADGFIEHKQFRLSLALQRNDDVQIKKFAKYINSQNINYTTKYRYSKLKNKICEYEMCSVSAADKHFVPQIIEKYNFKPRKTYNPPNLSFLDNDMNLFISFIIGFIDGDGTISKIKNSQRVELAIRCHHSWLNNLQYISDKITNHIGVPNKNAIIYDNCATLRMNSKMIRFLYQKSKELNLPTLERKWNKINYQHLLTIK